MESAPIWIAGDEGVEHVGCSYRAGPVTRRVTRERSVPALWSIGGRAGHKPNTSEYLNMMLGQGRLVWFGSGFAASLLCLVGLGCGGTEATGQVDGGIEATTAVPLSDFASIGEVAVLQAVKVSVGQDGAPIKETAPIVARRPALVRVFIKAVPGARFRGRTLKGTLVLVQPDASEQELTDERAIGVPSADAILGSSLNFSVPADQVQEGTSFRIRITDAAGGVLAYPADGVDSLRAARSGELKIRVVPIKYSGGSTVRLPDTSVPQLDRYKNTLFRMYPTATVSVTLREPLDWSTPVDPNGTGWDEVLNAVAEARFNDNVPDDIYYVGALAPEATLSAYCSGGCVLGLAPLAGPADVSARVALVAGFGGSVSATTLLQELGHAMGREHAKCGGAAGPDPKFPYPNGAIGSWGYDITTQALLDPDDYRDFMGYCQPVWVSDYTWAGLFKRLDYVRKTTLGQAIVGEVARPGDRVRAIRLDPARGIAHWGSQTLRMPAPTAATVRVVFSTPSAVREREVAVQALPTLGGSQLFVPADFRMPRSLMLGGATFAVVSAAAD